MESALSNAGHISELERIRQEHLWLLMPIQTAMRSIQTAPFFEWLERVDCPKAFAPVATQIFHHSATLPIAIGKMLAATPVKKGLLYQLYAEHAHEEADHHLLLMDWMLEHGLITSTKQAYDCSPTLETTACINLGYEFAVYGDHNGWIATLNSAIEFCFWNFFSVISKKMHDIGAPHKYFDVHVVADQHHSVMGLKYLSDADDAAERARLVRKALDGMTLWSAMVHSWIGIQTSPRFASDGTLRN
jgi:hypothetical protein